VRSLFLKIFLWFWAIQALIFLAVYAYWSMQPEPAQTRWHAATSSAITMYAQSAAEEADRYGQTGINNFFERLKGISRTQAGLQDESGKLLGGTVPEPTRELIAQAVRTGQPEIVIKEDFAYAAVRTAGPTGKNYIFVAAMPRPAPRPGRQQFEYVRWAIMILISGIICYLLTLYLTRPILRLRDATHELAIGHLSARAAADMGRRRDEIGSLVRDFNQMAERIETLVTSQQTLLRDISHELRSPLARLNVALGLVRQRAGEQAQPMLDRIEREAERMNQMIGQLINLARMETQASPEQSAPVQLDDVVRQVADDAEFEAQQRNCSVHLSQAKPVTTEGNPDLLRSAVENVVRNAVRYTAPGSSIDMNLKSDDGWAIVEVSDHGPGIPDADLDKVFRPFYRVADARDRESGGTGLGLAIAERAVRLHGGTVKAENRKDGGLTVTMRIPTKHTNGNHS
jgi:two-component system sensor histidine kinase CpxA